MKLVLKFYKYGLFTIALRTPVNIPFIKMEMLTNVLMALV